MGMHKKLFLVGLTFILVLIGFVVFMASKNVVKAPVDEKKPTDVVVVEDTTVDQTLIITTQLALGTETVALRGVAVDILKP